MCKCVCVSQQLAQIFMENIKVGVQNVLAAQIAEEEEEEGEGEEGCREEEEGDGEEGGGKGEEERDGEEGGGKGEEERSGVLAGVVLCLHKKTSAQYGGQLNTLHCTCIYMYICLFVRDMVGWVILLSFLSYFLKLVCYAHVFPCTCMYWYTLCIVPESHLRQLIFLRKSDCLGCAVLLCLAVCMAL